MIERKRLRYKQKLHPRNYCNSNTKTFETTTKECQKTKEKLCSYVSPFVLGKQFKVPLLRKSLQKKYKSRNSEDDRNNNIDTNIEPLEQQQGKIIYHEI